MIRVAITGSIGMGKSTVAKMFAAAGVPVFDADAVVRELQSPGGGLVAKIGELFPGCVRHGTLDRDCLAGLLPDPVPDDGDGRQQLDVPRPDVRHRLGWADPR